MVEEILTGRIQHRSVLLKVVGAVDPILVLQVEVRVHSTSDDFPDRTSWRDARTEDLAHLPHLYANQRT